MNLKLLGEIPMVKEISNISNNSYEDSDKIIDKIFNPILENIIKSIE